MANTRNFTAMANTRNFTATSPSAREAEQEAKTWREDAMPTRELYAMPRRALYASCTLCLLHSMHACLPSNTCLICAYSGGLWAYSRGGCVIGKSMGGVWHIEHASRVAHRGWRVAHRACLALRDSQEHALRHRQEHASRHRQEHASRLPPFNHEARG